MYLIFLKFHKCTYLPILLLITHFTSAIVGVKSDEDSIHLVKCRCWVLVDLTRRHFCPLNRRTREKTSESKWAIDWTAECITYQRLPSERSLSCLLACSMRSDNRARSSDAGEAS